MKTKLILARTYGNSTNYSVKIAPYLYQMTHDLSKNKIYCKNNKKKFVLFVVLQYVVKMPSI